MKIYTIVISLICSLIFGFTVSGYAQNSQDVSGDTSEIKDSIEKLKTKFHLQPTEFAIIVSPERQKMYLVKNDQIVKIYLISTGKAGIGSKMDSYKTPSGTHRVAEKIGAGAPIGTAFKGRKKIGVIRKIFTKETKIPRDSMTTRILWLDGQEEGLNRGKGIDSYQRYIYIHGTRKEWLLGEPDSLGCVKMGNTDIVELFDLVPLNTLVEIQDKNFNIKKD